LRPIDAPRSCFLFFASRLTPVTDGTPVIGLHAGFKSHHSRLSGTCEAFVNSFAALAKAHAARNLRSVNRPHDAAQQPGRSAETMLT
jgi:hypothetical protein